MFLIKEYLKYFRQQHYNELFSLDCINGLANIEKAYANQCSPKVIYEVQLGSTERTTDFSMQLLCENGIVKDYWLEFDYNVYMSGKSMNPCIFYDASAFLYPSEWWTHYTDYMSKLFGNERAVHLKYQLMKTVLSLDGLCPTLFQIGTMNSRTEYESVRIYTKDMQRNDIAEYLHRMQWDGDYSQIDRWMQVLEGAGARRGFSASFDVFSSGISSKIGLEFTVMTSLPTYQQDVIDMVSILTKHSLCRKEKGEAILKWIVAEPYRVGNRYIRNTITHVKMQFDNSKILGAKCYLGQVEKK